MLRLAFVPGLLLLTACSGALVSEKEAIFPTMYDTGSGEFIAIIGVTMGVDAMTRQDLRAELEMNVGGFVEGSSIRAEFNTALLEGIPTTEPSAHTAMSPSCSSPSSLRATPPGTRSAKTRAAR